jgi:hypothetical protein
MNQAQWYILRQQIEEVVSGRRGFISLPGFRRDHGADDLSTNWVRRIIYDMPDLEMYKHGRYGWCIGRRNPG